jgi:hypothetical protein
MLAPLRPESPIPRPMMQDSRWGHQVPSQQAAREEFVQQDKAAAQALIEQLAAKGLHVETGTMSWEGLPIFAAVMPETQYEELASREHRHRPDSDTAVPIKLGWGAVNGLPGYAGDQLSEEAAVLHAHARYLEAQEPTRLLPFIQRIG